MGTTGEKSRMKPSIGRIVHFNFNDQVVPAIVTGVNDDDTVDLTILFFNGIMHLSDIEEDEILPDGGPTGNHGTWFWPPRVP